MARGSTSVAGAAQHEKCPALVKGAVCAKSITAARESRTYPGPKSVAAGDRMAEREIASVVWDERDNQIHVTYVEDEPDHMSGNCDSCRPRTRRGTPD